MTKVKITTRQLEMLVNIREGRRATARKNGGPPKGVGGATNRCYKSLGDNGWLGPRYTADSNKLTPTGLALADASIAARDAKTGAPDAPQRS